MKRQRSKEMKRENKYKESIKGKLDTIQQGLRAKQAQNKGPVSPEIQVFSKTVCEKSQITNFGVWVDIGELSNMISTELAKLLRKFRKMHKCHDSTFIYFCVFFKLFFLSYFLREIIMCCKKTELLFFNVCGCLYQYLSKSQSNKTYASRMVLLVPKFEI